MRAINFTFDKIIVVTSLLLVVGATLNPYHLLPASALFPNLVVGFIVLIGLSFAFIITNNPLQLNKSTFTWFLLLLVILLQPIINTIDYPDSLISPLASLVCVLLFSTAVASVNEKKRLLQQVELGLIICLIISFFIQLMQLTGHHLSIRNLLVISPSSGRLDANVAQPNQLAFMFCLAQTGCLYWYELDKKKLWLLLFGVFSIAIALTLSRTGIVISIANIILFYIFLNQNIKQRILSMFRCFFIYILFYSLGIWLYRCMGNSLLSMSNSISQPNAVARFNEGSLYMRESLQQQAYLIFSDQPLTGVGWGNFVHGSMSNYDRIQWFAFSEHSHFFISQIASELGIVGLITLIPLSLFILKKFSFKMNSFEATCYSSIIIFLLYSCTEFPLWYVKYLLIFAFFIALLDNKSWLISNSVKKLLTLLSVGLMLGSIIYIKDFIKVNKIFSEVKNIELSEHELKDRYISMPRNFGMLRFKEQFLFYYIPINEQNLDYKIQLAKRVVPTDLNQSSLFKYGQLLALNKDIDMAGIIFKSACALEVQNGCTKITDRLEQLSIQDSETYTQYYDEVNRWVKTKKINSTN